MRNLLMCVLYRPVWLGRDILNNFHGTLALKFDTSFDTSWRSQMFQALYSGPLQWQYKTYTQSKVFIEVQKGNACAYNEFQYSK